MKRFIEGTDRSQATLFPDRLEDWIGENNPVRVIDVFVDALDYNGLGFVRATAAETGHHLIVAHDVVQTGSDRAQLAPMAQKAKQALNVDELDVVADRGYFSSEQIIECVRADVTVTRPKPMTSGLKAKGRFGKQDFRYITVDDVCICPAGRELTYRFTGKEAGLVKRWYWCTMCELCSLKDQCTTGQERRISRWEHERLVKDVQRRLDENPEAMRQRRGTSSIPSPPSRCAWVQAIS